MVLAATDATAQHTNSRWQHLTLEDGLSQSIAFDIVQDSAGFLWVATEDGLNRYDGYSFLHYFNDPDDPTSIASNYTTALHLDRSGELWVGTWGSGVSRYIRETNSFDHFPHDPGDPTTLSGSQIWAILEDHQGKLWICSDDGGLSVIDPGSGSVTNYRHDPTDPTSLASDQTKGIVEDSNGSLWIATGRGLDQYDRSTGSFVHHSFGYADAELRNDGALDSIALDGDGFLWLGSANGTLRRYDPTTGANVEFSPGRAGLRTNTGESISKLYTDPLGNVWVGSDGSGLSRYVAQTDSFVPYGYDPRIRSSLGSNRIRSIYRDRGGVLWVGAYGVGLSKMTPNAAAFAHYQHIPDESDGLVENVIFAVEEDRQGRVWLGTYGSGLNSFDPTAGTFEHYPPRPESPGGLSHGDIRALLEDSTGALWVGSFGGLNRMNADGSFTRYLEGDGPGALQANRIFSLYEDREGNLWVGTYGAGLARFDREAETFTHFRHDPTDPTSLSNDDVRAIHEDANGVLWVGTWNGGLNRMDVGTGTFERFRPDPADPTSLRSEAVFHIIEDHEGILWLATRMGIARVDPSDPGAGFRHFSRDQGLPDNMVYGMVADDEGQIWLSTNRGLARFNPATRDVALFDAKDGLQNNEFNAGAYTRLRSGELIFGGVQGFNLFNPSALMADGSPPGVVVTSVRRFHGDFAETLQLPAEGPLQLSYKDDFVSFEFAALDFAVPERNEYSYYLEGTNEGWLNLGSRREITFADLSHGNHVLLVRGTSGVGFGTGEPTRIRLAVSHPPWATPWFQGFVAALLLAVAFGIHRLRTAAIRGRAERLEVEVEREKLQVHLQQAQRLEAVGQLTGGIAHDFNNHLTVIIGSLELLADSEDSNDEFEDIAEPALAAAHRGAQLTQRLLAFARKQTLQPQAVDLRDLVSEMEDLLRRTLGETIVIERADESELWTCEVDSAQVENALLNLCLNARDAMPDGGQITIRTGNVVRTRAELSADGDQEPGDYVMLEVSDQGEGIPADVISKVFDPFFTTKAEGKGSGLGLSMVYGFVTQSGGHVHIDSSENLGTSVQLYFPRAEERAQTETEQPPPTIEGGHGELVLVVEDDVAVKTLVIDTLERLGYRTLEAEDGAGALEALKLQDPSEPVALLFTDVVLPGGMDGLELARIVRDRHPEMPVLFTSGYAQESVLRDDGVHPDVDVLPKPFSKDELAEKVSEAVRSRDSIPPRRRYE
ncbi:MAG: two-component regulator propeller domain-containing protein [Woeseiaceae bacterium]|nr:two-component regulator propeller domain-containing protein [Woeseiaceae bacterium]